MTDNKKKTDFGTYVAGVLILGGLGGWLGGLFGLVIGAAIAIWAISSSGKEEAKKITSISSSGDNEKKEVPNIDEKPVTHTIFNYSLYSKLVPELLAVCISADGIIEEAEVETATLLIENDEYINDKQIALASLAENIETLSAAASKSKAVFKLKATPIIHQAFNVKGSLEKDRINVFLDSLIESVQSGDKTQTLEIAIKIKEKLNTQPELTKQEAAEIYIRKSGDQEAISMLDAMKKTPGQYGEKLKQAAKSNPVMKTALGVFTGMIAANLVMGAINQYQMEQAFTEFSTELENIGGIDNVGLGEYESTLSDASIDGFPEAGHSENYGDEYASADDLDTSFDTDLDLDDGEGFFSDLFS